MSVWWAVMAAHAAVTLLMVWSCVQVARHRITNVQHCTRMVWFIAAQTAFAMWYELTAPGITNLVCMVFFISFTPVMWRIRHRTLVMAALVRLPVGVPIAGRAIRRDGSGELPGRVHRCRVVVEVRTDDVVMEACPCGAVRFDGRHWLGRNSRRGGQHRRRGRKRWVINGSGI